MKNELRIGNLVYDCDGSVYTIASGADIDGLWKPIPITEDWLLKLGFQEIEEKGDYFIAFQGRYHFVEMLDSVTRYSMGYHNDGVVQIPIQYVHQLQNLYFALTGNELK